MELADGANKEMDFYCFIYLPKKINKLCRRNGLICKFRICCNFMACNFCVIDGLRSLMGELL